MNKNSRLYTTVSAIMYVSPVSFTSDTICSHSAIVVAIGTVPITCLPAWSAAIDIGAWSPIGELICT